MRACVLQTKALKIWNCILNPSVIDAYDNPIGTTPTQHPMLLTLTKTIQLYHNSSGFTTKYDYRIMKS